MGVWAVKHIVQLSGKHVDAFHVQVEAADNVPTESKQYLEIIVLKISCELLLS